MSCSEHQSRTEHTTSLWAFIVSTALAGLLVGGCISGTGVKTSRDEVSPDRFDRGAVVILPGIEGESNANQNVRKGLRRAGIPHALAIYRWGFPMRGIGLVVNEMNTSGNRAAAAKLAEKIVEYQQKYPGRPIHLMGHSAGGGIAVFTLEALGQLPDAKPVDGIILLSAALSADYRLDAALRMSRKGIINVHNPEDVVMLGAGATAVGSVDGGHGDAAGRTGFHGRYPNVHNIRITALSEKELGSPHFLSTDPDFIARRAPSWILSDTWPSGGF